MRITLEAAYATAFRFIGNNANLLLRRVLSIECYKPVKEGALVSTEHLDVEYLAFVPADSRAVISEESDDLRWWDLDDLPPDLDTALIAMIKTAISR
jgi:hypothetical protein